MAYFPSDMPRPVPTMDDQGFWEACSKQELRFQSCAHCGVLRHPPAPICGQCYSTETRWVRAPTQGEIFTFTVIRHAAHPAVAEQLPYVAALIVFPDLPGVRLVSNVTHCSPSDVHVGMKVSLWWDDIGEGMFLPRFRPQQEKT